MVSGPYTIPAFGSSHFTLHTACLNTILRNIKPTKDAVFCSRTCRIATLVEHGQQHAKDLGRQNAVDLLKLLEWNEANKIKFMRISSEMFPFASHDKWGYGLEYAKAELEKVGEYAKEHGHRLTTHPGQFTQRKTPVTSFNNLADSIFFLSVGSPTAKVVTNSIRELECVSFNLVRPLHAHFRSTRPRGTTRPHRSRT